MSERHLSREDDDLGFEGLLTEQRDERISPSIVIVGAVALVVGIFLWGSLLMSAASSVGDVLNDSNLGPDESGGAPVLAEETEAPLDCDAYGPTRALSQEREAAYQAQCVTPTPVVSPTPTIDASLNRGDCSEIRGTDYRSPEERQWFLANCVSN